MTLNEKAAYLRGMADGLNLCKENPNDKLMLAVIDLLEDMALTVSDHEEVIDLLNEDMDTVMDDLYEEDEDDLDEFEDLEDDEDDDEEEELYEVECPKCGEKIYLDFDEIEQGDVTCPACGELLEIEVDFEDCDCEDDDCDCCHHDHE